MEFVHDSQIVDAIELSPPVLGVIEPVLHVSFEELVKVCSEEVFLGKVLEVIELNISHHILLQSFVFFLGPLILT